MSTPEDHSAPEDCPNGVATVERIIWRECWGDKHSNNIIITQGGGIGINCGGSVIVMSLKDWHTLASKMIIKDE